MRAATIVVRPTPRGLLVCTAAYMGNVRYGRPGDILDTLQMLLLARGASEQGGRLLIEIQADGVAAYPTDVLPPEWVEHRLGGAR